jgi:hypothetical protein
LVKKGRFSHIGAPDDRKLKGNNVLLLFFLFNKRAFIVKKERFIKRIQSLSMLS